MSIRTAGVVALAALALVAAAVPASADPTAEQIRKVRDAVAPSTVVVAYYVQREDGARADIRMLGTVVGEGNLVMFPAAAIPAQLPLSQFHDFKIVVSKGNELETYTAEYLGKDDQAQVAFLKVTDPKAPVLPALEFDEKTLPDVGDPVLSFAMLGEPDGYVRLLQMARVAGRVDQPVTTFMCSAGLGSPGTPVLMLDGKAIGIVGLVRLNRGTNAKPNWAVAEILWPTARFIERLKNPPKGGAAVKRPWLGVQTLTPVTKDLAEYFKLGDRRGVVVGQVIEGGPGAKAGLKGEDIILAIDGKNVEGTEGQLVENFSNDIRERKVGDSVTLEVWRGGKTEKLKVALTEQPKGAAEAERYAVAGFGLTVREMVLADRVQRELPMTEKGVVAAFIAPASWTKDSGLQAGDIIKKVQDQDTPTLAEFKKIVQAEVKKKPKEIVLFVLRSKNETQIVRIEPRWDAKPADTPAAPEKKDEKPAEKK